MGFDKGIKKAYMLLEDHIGMFTEFLGDYTKKAGEKGIVYYFEDYSKYSKTNISYVASKKMVSNTYSMEVLLILKNISMEDDWKGKLTFSGAVSIKSAVIKKIEGRQAVVDALNKDNDFLNRFIQCNRIADIAHLTFEYSNGAQELRVRIYPYSGGFLWIKIPPVFYPLRMGGNEVYSICELISHIGKKFKNYSGVTYKSN